MRPAIQLTEAPPQEAAAALFRLLRRYNEQQSGVHYDYVPLAILLRDPVTEEIVGGLWGGTSFGFLHVDALIPPPEFRGQGLGSELMAQAEEEAVRRGCRGVWLDTFSFQAPGFYKKLGYAVFGTLENNPAGHNRYFMQKWLEQDRRRGNERPKR